MQGPSADQFSASPSDFSISPAPSLLVYLVLAALATGLGWYGAYLLTHSSYWSGYVGNLSAGLATTIVILMLVEGRVRSNDIALFRRFLVWLTLLWAPERARRLELAGSLLQAIASVARPPRTLSRGQASVLAATSPFLWIVGAAASGKTTAALELVRRLATSLVHTRGRGPVPLYVPMRQHIRASLITNLWHEGVRPYRRSTRAWVDKLLRRGEAIVVLDGVDESPKVDAVGDEIAALRAQFPKSRVVVTSRPTIQVPIPAEAELVDLD